MPRPSSLVPALVLAAAGLQGCIAVVTEEHKDHETVVEVVALQHATAGELAASMTGLLQESDSAGPAVSFVSDERTNSIVLRGQRKDVVQAREAIEKLDRKID